MPINNVYFLWKWLFIVPLLCHTNMDMVAVGPNSQQVNSIDEAIDTDRYRTCPGG